MDHDLNNFDWLPIDILVELFTSKNNSPKFFFYLCIGLFRSTQDLES